MMGRTNGQGQSSSTRAKQEFFGYCLGYSLALHHRRDPDKMYFHLDLTAGSGSNSKVGVAGTPELFFRQAKKYPDMPIMAKFVEVNRKRSAELKARLAQTGLAQRGLFGVDRSFRVIRADNAKVLPRTPEGVARWDNPATAVGSIVSDPNGYSPLKGGLDIEAASEALRQLPRFMILISFQYGRANMVRRYKEQGCRGPVKNPCIRRIKDYLPLRRHWLISEPAGNWIYLCGTCEPYPEDRRRQTFVDIDSPRGREIHRICDTIGEHFS